MCLGVPGKIISLYQADGIEMAKIDFGGVTRDVCIQTLPEAKVGDYTIIHAGFALNILSEEEAMETLQALEELSLVEQELYGEES